MFKIYTPEFSQIIQGDDILNPDGFQVENNVYNIGLRKLAYGQGKWISAAGSQTPPLGTLITNITSTDGINWTGFAGGPPLYDNSGNTGPPIYDQNTYNRYNDILYANNIWVSVSSRGGTTRAISSPDGMTWTRRDTADGATGPAYATSFNGIAYDQGQFVIVGGNSSYPLLSKIFTSPDGMTWTGRSILNGPNSPDTDIDTVAGQNNWQQSAYGNNKWVAVGSTGTTATKRVITSIDGGIKWYSPSGLSSNMNTRSWQRIVYGNGLFVAVSLELGSDFIDCIATSLDGITWTLRNAPVSMGLLSVYFARGIFMACSRTGKIIKSSDGINWEFIYNNPLYTQQLYGITYANGIWLVNANSGTNNRILRLDYTPELITTSRPTPITKQIKFSSSI